jgi:hypothetical protein
MLEPASFAVGITALEEVFDKDLSDRVKDAYFAALSRLTPQQWERAVNRCIAECRFLPRPAELLERAGVNADPAADALEALAQVRRAIGAQGRYRSVDFADKAINAASTRKAPARSVDPGRVRELTAGLAAKKSIGGES